MYNSVKFKVESSVNEDKKRLLEFFFQDWIDGLGDNEFSIERIGFSYYNRRMSEEIYRVDFSDPNDVLILKLKGIPDEFQKYLKMMV
jgi:hypothetical protein